MRGISDAVGNALVVLIMGSFALGAVVAAGIAVLVHFVL